MRLTERFSELSFFKFVIVLGVQCFGLTLFTLRCLFRVIENGSINRSELAMQLVASIISGTLWGALMWIYERKKADI
ncbi:hypothetical protein [Dyella sp.]|uniref:hypothetical protein n=1 Tax=Dyella sp. TaxID=1869338 RepID=UPI002D7746D2|nr:hypothetical protein [Dyella sp.]HET7331678.1 hypothetical protein [Dyella sp.]